jgi:hypothetical protein
MQFNNYNNATTNGAQLNTTQMGMNQVATGGAPMGQVGGAGISDVTVQSPQVPQVGGMQGQQGSGFFSPQGGAGLILGGIQVLGNLWSSFQAHKMAKEQMAFAREQWDTNLANQTQTYNTALEDRIRGRYATGTRSEEQLQGEIDQHSL